MREGEANQRSGFQFELFKLNLILNGALIAFALNKPDDWSRALLACPFISFILFSLWFHHALAIRLDPVETPQAPGVRRTEPSQRIRRWSFLIAMLSNFVVVPLAAVLIYQLKEYSWLSFVAVGLLVLTVVMFGFWYNVEYHGAPRRELPANKTFGATADTSASDGPRAGRAVPPGHHHL